MLKLDKILSSFKKTQAQLDKYIEEKDQEIIDLSFKQNVAQGERHKASCVNENLKKLLGEV